MTSTIPAHHLWYNVKDSQLIRRLVKYEDNDPFFTAVMLVGWAGTGKTSCITKLVNVPRVHFTAPTNYAGSGLYTALRRKSLSAQCSTTIFKLLGENMNDQAFNANVYNNHLDHVASSGTARSLSDMWARVSPAFNIITERRFKNADEKNRYLTPDMLKAIRDQAAERGWFEYPIDDGQQSWYANGSDGELAGICAYIAATKCVAARSIPTALKYDILVVDEMGREPALSALRLAYDFSYVRSLYGYPAKLKIVCEGSCTQQTCINTTDHSVNNYSGITMISAPFFDGTPFMTALSAFNRRCSDGDTAKTAIWMNFVDKMERGLPLSPSHKHDFLKAFEAKTFVPTPLQLTRDYANTVGRVYVAERHKMLKEVEKAIKPFMRNKAIREYFVPGSVEDAKAVPHFYNAHTNLGSGYNSVVYDNEKWVRELDKRGEKESYRYMNERTLYIGSVYDTTHRVGVIASTINGSYRDFLSDYDEFRYNMSHGAVIQFVSCVIVYLESIDDLLTEWVCGIRYAPTCRSINRIRPTRRSRRTRAR